jgi:hypothetical protein
MSRARMRGMAQTSSRPHYAAAIFESETLRVELAPIAISDARNDEEALEFAIDRAGKWAVENGVNYAWIKVVRDGVGFSPIPMKVDQ